MASFSRYLPLALLIVACGDDGASTHASTTDTATTDTAATDTTATATTDTATTNINPSEPTTTTGPTTTDPTTTDPTATTGGPGDPAIYEACEALNADGDALLEFQCMCQVKSGDFPDMTACLDELGYSPEANQCRCEVFAQHPDTRTVLDCVGPPQKSLLDCMLAAGCDDSPAMVQCADTWYPIVSACPDASAEVEQQLELQCVNGPPFVCGSGETVPASLQCDFKDDCADGSDELGCADVFTCTNGTVLPDDFKCDGFFDCCEGESDCRDTSDEAGCPEFMCTSGESIPLPQKCDGADNCIDASDELDCPIFTCGSGEKIPEDLHCDGIPDCVDSSDELGCP